MVDKLDIDPRTSALLVLDVQQIIVEGSAGPASPAEKATLLERSARLIAASRSAAMRIIYVQNGFRAGYPEVHARNKAIETIREDHKFAPGAAGNEIHPAVAPRPDEVVVTKHRVSAFVGTDLELVLRANGIETLILIGIATSRVVLSTLRYAADADYRLLVAHDCCSDSDPEVHRVLVEKVFTRAAIVVTADEIISALG
jgi:nicotinamidase-related amidase